MKAVFFDRDGVLNECEVRDGLPYAPTRIEDVKVFPDAADALARLKRAGYLLLVATNQPDVSRGVLSRADVEVINADMGARLPIDAFLVCWHDDADGCACRKPKPGLLLDAAARYGIDLPNSFFIGDRWRDVEAGAAAGCRTILIDHKYRERTPVVEPDFRTNSLSAAADWILQTH